MKDQIWDLLNSTNREGMDKLIEFLEKSDFFKAPASTRFHGNFEGGLLTTAFTNTPALTNLKNDYSVWGTRKTINGTEVPIHARYAIDQKPFVYITFPKTKFNNQTNTLIPYSNCILIVQKTSRKFLVQVQLSFPYYRQGFEQILQKVRLGGYNIFSFD